MKTIVAIVVAMLATACAREAAPDPAQPSSYAVQIPVNPEQGSRLQRVALPAAVLVAAGSRDLDDIRVFDARGRVLPAAKFAAQTEGEGAKVRLPAFEIRQDRSGDRQRSVAVGSDGAIVARIDDRDASVESEAALLDTRSVADPVIKILLAADLPPQRIVNFKLEASADLKAWEAIGETAMFRADGETLDVGTVAVSGISLRDRYVRVSWNGPGVNLQAAELVHLPQNAPARLAVPGTGAKLVTAHDIRFRVPVAETPAALILRQSASDGIVPVRLFGRDSVEAPWEMLGAATLREDEPGGAMLAFNDSRLREYKLEADARTAGFSAAPAMTLLFDAPELLVRFSGHPPYTLAAGLAGAPGAWLTPDELAPDWRGQFDRLPRASAQGSVPALSLAPAEGSDPLSSKRLALWLALLAGTAVLAFAVWRLMRGSGAARADS